MSKYLAMTGEPTGLLGQADRCRGDYQVVLVAALGGVVGAGAGDEDEAMVDRLVKGAALGREGVLTDRLDRHDPVRRRVAGAVEHDGLAPTYSEQTGEEAEALVLGVDVAGQHD